MRLRTEGAAGGEPSGPPLVLIGNPGNRRTTGLQAARACWKLPPAELISYMELIGAAEQGVDALAELLSQRLRLAGGSGLPQLRLDAPGENDEVERAMIRLGDPQRQGDDRLAPALSGSASAIRAGAVDGLRSDKGLIRYPAQWFRGFCRLLALCERAGKMAGESRPAGAGPQWINAPADIARMFDKRQCQRILAAHGVPIPRMLGRDTAIGSYEQLRAAMAAERMNRLFIKLASGSGASGVIAYQFNPRTGEERAVTTMAMERGCRSAAGKLALYNSKRLRSYADNGDIRALIDWLCAEGAQIEAWIPKAQTRGCSYDLRQLVVAGRACHLVARLSRSPITNLHLRNERMEAEQMELGEEPLLRAAAAAESTLAAFPASWMAGVDVLLQTGSLRPYIVDVNPFGDLLYHIRYHGMNPYEWQMKLMRQRMQKDESHDIGYESGCRQP